MKIETIREYSIRCLILIIALFLCGIGVTLVRISCLGMEPFTAVCYTYSRIFHCPMGYMTIGINAVIIIFSIVFVSYLLGPGTIIAMAGLGYACDFWSWIMSKVIGWNEIFTGFEHLHVRLIFFLIGLLFMVIPTAFVLAADIGINPYDTVGYIVEKKSKGKIKFKTARVVQDSIVVIITFAGAKHIGMQWQVIGIGTVLLAFFVGPLLSFIKEKIAEPFIHIICEKLY